MKKYLIVVASLLLTGLALHCSAQTVQFTGGTWTDILAKAKSENKYIFVDCMATWCAPCRNMDRLVYTNSDVAGIMNAQFISVKLQFDTTKNDNEETKQRYGDAHRFGSDYKVKAFPTYLFFTSQGKLVHAGVGYKPVKDFLGVVRAATDPAKQYYTLLNDYLQGKKDYPRMLYLAELVRAIGDKELAKIIARDEIDNYLVRLPDSQLFTKENLGFIAAYTSSADQQAFDLFYRRGKAVDHVMDDSEQHNFSTEVVESVISREELYPKLWKNNNLKEPLTDQPDWNKWQQAIASRYNSYYAEKAVLDAQLLWYKTHQQWAELIAADFRKIDRYGVDTVGLAAKVNLNNMAWYDIFQHSHDPGTLRKAAGWMVILVNAKTLSGSGLYPGWLDTYANLLYKAGDVANALAWEEKAEKLVPKDKGIQQTYEKMRTGQATWPNP